MRYLIISAFAAVGLLAATTLLRSHSLSIDNPAGSGSTISVQELQKAAGANGLPTEEFEDLSLVFAAGGKR